MFLGEHGRCSITFSPCELFLMNFLLSMHCSMRDDLAIHVLNSVGSKCSQIATSIWACEIIILFEKLFDKLIEYESYLNKRVSSELVHPTAHVSMKNTNSAGGKQYFQSGYSSKTLFNLVILVITLFNLVILRNDQILKIRLMLSHMLSTNTVRNLDMLHNSVSRSSQGLPDLKRILLQPTRLMQIGWLI